MTTVPLELNLDLLDEPGRVFKDVQNQPVTDGGGGSDLGFDDDSDADADVDVASHRGERHGPARQL